MLAAAEVSKFRSLSLKTYVTYFQFSTELSNKWNLYSWSFSLTLSGSLIIVTPTELRTASCQVLLVLLLLNYY